MEIESSWAIYGNNTWETTYVMRGGEKGQRRRDKYVEKEGRREGRNIGVHRISIITAIRVA